MNVGSAPQHKAKLFSWTSEMEDPMGIAFTLPNLSLVHSATHVGARSLRLRLDVKGMVVFITASVQHVSTANCMNGPSI